ncbi:natural resistance-associated macrophage protein-domain-containing protein [Gongronella butleri]|nr:natural resistance-associated macrophage protein-domain-containing protein [Gongronella butleri]
MTLLHRTSAYLKRLAKYIGPGFMIAVGYLDPGNWSVDMEGGSRFGYKLLFVILLSNLMAIFLQNLSIRLGTIAGLDLASASRRHLPRYLNLFLYALAEIAIIATDLAEVIGSAIALNLLFPSSISLPAGVAITALDVLIILLFYNEDTADDGSGTGGAKHDMRFVHYFEWFVMLLVGAVGVCFIIELAFSPVVFSDVMLGMLPSVDLFQNPDCLYVAIGVIGATVMPHNLFLHSFIVQSRCHAWRAQRPHDTELFARQDTATSSPLEDSSPASSDTLFEAPDADAHLDQLNIAQKEESDGEAIALLPVHQHDDHGQGVGDGYDDDDDDQRPLIGKQEQAQDQDVHEWQESQDMSVAMPETPAWRSMDELRAFLVENIKRNLHYSFIDLVVALSFAFFINSSILIVAAANFFDASDPAKAAATMSDLFDAHDLLDRYIGPAAALVFAIALLCAGQSSTLTATLAGQVVMSGFLGMSTRPWLRRLVTRLIAIIPAMLAACFAGRSGLSQLLITSQVILSIQLPFAVVPLVYFTSNPKIMSVDLLVPSKHTLDAPTATALQKDDDHVPFLADHDDTDTAHAHETPLLSSASSSMDNDRAQMPPMPTPLSFPNGILAKITACIVTIILMCLNSYLVISTLFASNATE